VIPPITLEGSVHAPEFPGGLDWLNTSTPLRLKDLRGKFVLLDFWTFCCINCMHILPDLRRLETKYSQELVVIGVHSAKFKNEKDTSQIRQAILRYGIRHPWSTTPGFEVWQSYAANAWPTLVLINPLGKIIGTLSGEGVYEPFDGVLSQAIPFFEAKGQLKRSPTQFALEEARRANTLLEFPGKISSDEKSSRLFITDSNHNRILIADAAGKILDAIGSGVEGSQDGTFEEVQFHHPQGTFLAGDVLYIADTENHLVRAADLRARKVWTILAKLNSPWTSWCREGRCTSRWPACISSGWQTRPPGRRGPMPVRDAKTSSTAAFRMRRWRNRAELPRTDGSSILPIARRAPSGKRTLRREAAWTLSSGKACSNSATLTSGGEGPAPAPAGRRLQKRLDLCCRYLQQQDQGSGSRQTDREDACGRGFQ